MAKRVFKAELSVKSIENLKQQLIQYRDVELPNKCRELATRLLALGVEVAQAKIDESPLGKYVTIKTDISSDKMGTKGILIATGENKESEGFEPFNTLLAIEFGAGIYYNRTANPKADDLGFGVGTFPGQIHAFEDGWYYWDDTEQKWRYTHGVKATMPMYEADMAIIRDVVKIAREVFN